MSNSTSLNQKETTMKNISIFALLGQSIKVPMATTVAVWETALELVEDTKEALPVVSESIKDMGRIAHTGITYATGATIVAINAALPEEEQMSVEEFRSTKTREEKIFSSLNLKMKKESSES